MTWYYSSCIGYGMTESLLTHLQPNESSLHKPGSCGQILADMECKVCFLHNIPYIVWILAFNYVNMKCCCDLFQIACQETGKALGPFEQGEICTRGSHIMKGK